MDPDASPAPRLDIAGDAFSSFAAGEDAKANATRSEKEDPRAASSFSTSASLEAELADLELDLAAFEAALKSGGRALRRATSREAGEEGGGPGTATPSRTNLGDDDVAKESSRASGKKKKNKRRFRVRAPSQRVDGVVGRGHRRARVSTGVFSCEHRRGDARGGATPRQTPSATCFVFPDKHFRARGFGACRAAR